MAKSKTKQLKNELDDAAKAYAAAVEAYNAAFADVESFNQIARQDEYVAAGYTIKDSRKQANNDGVTLRSKMNRLKGAMNVAEKALNDAKRALKRAEKEDEVQAKKEKKEHEKMVKKNEKAVLEAARKEEKERQMEELRQRRIDSLVNDEGIPEDDVWKFEVDKNENYIHSVNNIVNMLLLHPYFSKKLEKNEFTGFIEYDRVAVNDDDMATFRVMLERFLNFYDKNKTSDALRYVANQFPYHPVKEVLENLKWDGVKRVETFFIERLGAPDTPLTREITAKFFYAIIERIYSPGCTFDHYLIVSDKQGGTGKTKTFTRMTEVLAELVNFPLTNIIRDITKAQDNVLMLQRSVIGLFDESEGMKYSNLETFKSFISQECFSARLPYGAGITDMDVHCVYAVTTNDEAFLTDSSTPYERRAWILDCKGDPKRTKNEWDLLNGDDVLKNVWAEVMAWKNGIVAPPYKMTNGDFNVLTPNAEVALRKLQSTKKTLTQNTPLNNTIDNMFTSMYSKETFINEEDFVKDYQRKNRHLDENDYDKPLVVIPVEWLIGGVMRVMNSRFVGRDNVKNAINNKIDEMFNNGTGKWKVVENKKYGTRSLPCYVLEGSDADDVKPSGNVDLLSVQSQPKPVQMPIKPKPVYKTSNPDPIVGTIVF